MFPLINKRETGINLRRIMDMRGLTAKDVQEVLPDVLGHRVKLSSRTRAEGISVRESMEQMCRNVKSPRT